MFEQTLLLNGARTHNPWTVLVSFTGQMLAVGIATLLPLVLTDRLPQAQLAQHIFYMVPSPPRPLPPPPPDTGATVEPRIITRQIIDGRLLEPVRMPPRPARIIEEPAPSLPSSEVGVVGGTGVLGEGRGGVIGSLLDSLRSTVMPAPAPPPAVARTAAAPAPPKRITVGGFVQQAKIIHQPIPVYPPLARQARISGVVRLEGVIARDGTIQQLRAVSGHPLLIPAALDAVRKWVYQPTLLNGEPVEVIAPIEVIFNLN